MAESFGADRSAAVCRELTKTYEEVKRGGLGELADWAAEGVRGEITIVVSGASESEQREASGLVTADDWVAAVAARESDGEDRKTAIGAVAKEAGVPRREVYAAVVAAKGTSPAP
jgi:16S rRNA (cytidine1402-2'-O)-methyltransferase